MPVSRRPVPLLPKVPRARSIAADIRRSYPTGRQEFSRVFVGNSFEVTISTSGTFPRDIRLCLVTSINATEEGEWTEVTFDRRDGQTFACKIVPTKPGLHLFWVRFSLDGGKTWLRDPVPDAWVLVDPATVDQLRMYTLIPNVSGTIPEWSEALVRIKQMGFNAVHLLPLTMLDTSKSPYAAKDLFSVDPSYVAAGTGRDGLEQLEDFIEVARRLELRLCFDLVLNHVGTESHIAERAPEWIVPDPANPDGLRRARYWSGTEWLPWTDLVLIDFEHPSQQIRNDIYDYMTEYALFWAQYASATNGFVRFDNLHSSDKTFIDAVTKVLHKEYPNVGILAEYFTDSATLLHTIPKWELNLILATPWDSRFVPQLREYMKYLHSISQSVRFFMPITSHDSGSPAQEFGSVESTVPRYVAAALMGTGATGITQGVEWGQLQKINFIGSQPKMIMKEPPKFGDFLRRVNEIVEREPAFRQGQNCQFVDNNHHAVIAVFRKDPRPGKVGFLIVCNFDIFHEHAFETNLSAFLITPGPHRCVDLLSGQERTFKDAEVCLVIPACSAVVLRFES